MSDEAVRKRAITSAAMPPFKSAPTVLQALNAVKSAVGAVGKTERNSQQGYAFRGVDAVVNAAAPELNKHGVVVIPQLISVEYDTVPVGRNQTPIPHARVTVRYRFYGPAGDYIDAVVPGESMDSGDKATPKAMSVAWRTALIQTLNLPTGDVDPDATTYERSVEPTLASKAQLMALKDLLKGLGHEDREECLTIAEKLVGHKLANTPGNMTTDEAAEVNIVLERCKGNSNALKALLERGDSPGTATTGNLY